MPITLPAPQVIDTAPRDAATTLLVYCPDLGGWHTAEWLGAKWLDSVTLSHELQPTHWTIVPDNPRKPVVNLHELAVES